MRVIFYAEPRDPDQKPKAVADEESLEARWVTVEEFKAFSKIRGYELVDWGNYIDNGGQIFPMSTFTDEVEDVPLPPNLAAIVEVLSSKAPASALQPLLTPSVKPNEPLRAGRTRTLMHMAASHSAEATVMMVKHGGRVLKASNLIHFAAKECSPDVLEVLLHQLLEEASPEMCIGNIMTPVIGNTVSDIAKGQNAKVLQAFIEKLKS